MPIFVDDDTDRGYRNVTGRAFAEFAATDALTLRARGWRAAGRTEYSAQTFGDPPYAPVSQDFENSVYSFEGEYRVEDGLGVRASVSRALDDIEQLQAGFGPAEFDYARTQRTNVDVQVDLAHDRHACAQLRRCSAATRTPARNPSARCSTKTRW